MLVFGGVTPYKWSYFTLLITGRWCPLFQVVWTLLLVITVFQAPGSSGVFRLDICWLSQGATSSRLDGDIPKFYEKSKITAPAFPPQEKKIQPLPRNKARY